jgi:hypothetical protein
VQKPSLARFVLVPTDCLLGQVQTNGADVAPAVITRVWSDTMVNVQIFLDAGPVVARTSVHLYDTAEDAAAGAPSAERAFAELRCYWPPRV